MVLGIDTADDLFGADKTVGQEVTVGGMTFTVIGVVDKRRTAFGGGKNTEDNKGYFPITTFHKIHPEELDYWITLKYDDAKNLPLVQDEVTELLRRRRKVANEAADNFAVFGTDTLTRLWNQVTNGLFLLLFALSSVALMVGGVGVMNIMLVSVTERNARDRDTQGDWGDARDDSGAVHAGGGDVVCDWWGGRRGDRQRDRDGAAVCDSIAGEWVVDCAGVWEFLCDWADFRDLSGL